MLHSRPRRVARSGGAGRISRAGRCAGRGHHAAGRHLRRDDRSGQCRGRRRRRARRGAHRLRRAGRAGPPGARRNSTGWARPRTRIVVSGDLDEFSIAGLRAEPVDSYGVGTSLVTGSGAPTAGMVYKLVEVDGMPVQKRSSHKESQGGRKEALRRVPPDRHDHRGGCVSGRPAAHHRRAVPGVDHPAGPRRRGGGRHGNATWPPPASWSRPGCTACRGRV